jgi:hypothetical protein
MRNNSPGEAQALLNARNVTYTDFTQDLVVLHDRVKSWRFVGEVLGTSGAYARLIAQGHRVASSATVLRWIEYRAVNKPASPKRQPRRFYRPCMSVELGEIMREYGWSPEVILWQWVKTYREQETP